MAVETTPFSAKRWGSTPFSAKRWGSERWAAASMLERSHGRGMLNAGRLGAGGRGDGGLGEDGALPRPPGPHLVPDTVQARHLCRARPCPPHSEEESPGHGAAAMRAGSPNLSWTLTAPGPRLGLVAALTRRALPALLAPHCLFIAVSVVVSGRGSGSWI